MTKSLGANMKAMIMAAGVGTRLMPLTADIPKPMIPMANRPLMQNIINLLDKHDFNQIIANLHYHAGKISEYFGDGSNFGVNLTYSREDELLGTAGGVKNCQWFLDDTFVVVSGDALTDINLTSLVQAHKQKGALATLALKAVEEVQQFGIVITANDGRIESFQEKPGREEALSNRANTGIYVFEPEIFNYIPAGEFYDFGRQVFPHLVKIGAPFYGVNVDRYWCDVGNINTYRQAHSDILQGKVEVVPDGQLVTAAEGRVLTGSGVAVGTGVHFQGQVVIGPGCSIGDNVLISDSVIWNNTIIRPGTVLRDCIVGSNCQVGDGTAITAGAVIASGTRW